MPLKIAIIDNGISPNFFPVTKLTKKISIIADEMSLDKEKKTAELYHGTITVLRDVILVSINIRFIITILVVF